VLTIIESSSYTPMRPTAFELFVFIFYFFNI